tara:strand:+ start:308 stop:1258 length:951 start_codon:yes stop_codon:yes gene_type:complete
MVNNEKPVSIAISGISGEIFSIDTCHNIIDYINLNSKKVNIMGDLSINGIITNYIIEDLSYRIQQLSTISAEGLDIDNAQLSNLILDVSNIYQTIIDLSGLNISSALDIIDDSFTNIYEIIADLSINGTTNGASSSEFNDLSANFYSLVISNTSNTSNKLVNYVYTNSNNGPIYYVDVSSEIIEDLSLNISPILQNSKINVNISLNYLTSCYPNTFLKLELYYKVDELDDVSFGQCILGTENTSFARNVFNINIITEPTYQAGSIINYYIKASIYSVPATNGNIMDFSNLVNENKPQILFNQLGNSIGLQELSNIF